MLNMMLDARSKDLGLVIQYVGKEKVSLIASEYDKYVLFPLLVHVYKCLNLSIKSEIVVLSTLVDYEMYDFKVGSLYQLMEISEEMVLSVVKENQEGK